MNEFFKACAEYPFWAGSLFTVAAWTVFWVSVGWEPLVSVKHVTVTPDEDEKEDEEKS